MLVAGRFQLPGQRPYPTVSTLPSRYSPMAGLSLWRSTRDLKEAIGLLSYQWRTETCVSLTGPFLPKGEYARHLCRDTPASHTARYQRPHDTLGVTPLRWT